MKQIPESELILNSDGSIYHLNLLPDDISHIIINVGDPDRVAMVSDHFEKIILKKQKREFVTHTGIYKGKKISVISTGIGTDNIDIVYNELDALANIDLKTRMVKPTLAKLHLIRIGTSGALQPDIAPDNFVFSRYGLGLDGLLNFYDKTHSPDEGAVIESFRNHFPNQGIFPQSYLTSCSAQLEHVLSEDMHKGITASCSGFYGPQGRALRLEISRPEMIQTLSRFRFGDLRITNFEMETGAMYGLARLMGHECCSVNVIVANRITHKFSHHAHDSIKNLIKLVLDRIAGSDI